MGADPLGYCDERSAEREGARDPVDACDDEVDRIAPARERVRQTPERYLTERLALRLGGEEAPGDPWRGVGRTSEEHATRAAGGNAPAQHGERDVTIRERKH